MPDTHHAYEHLQGIYFPIAIAVFGVVCLGVAALLIALLFAGCGKRVAPTAPPPTVTVVQPVARDVIEWDEYIGRLESPETVEVRARVSGFLRAELPEDWDRIAHRGPGSRAQTEFSLEFCPRLAAAGLLVPHWPKEYGGQGL